MDKMIKNMSMINIHMYFGYLMTLCALLLMLQLNLKILVLM